MAVDMKKVVVRYKTKPDRADENQALVKSVFKERRKATPAVRYAAFRLEGGVTFAHVAFIEGDQNPLGEVAAFKEFQREIGDRCEEPPATQAATVVGSFRLRLTSAPCLCRPS